MNKRKFRQQRQKINSTAVRHIKMWVVFSKDMVDDLENPENRVHK